LFGDGIHGEKLFGDNYDEDIMENIMLKILLNINSDSVLISGQKSSQRRQNYLVHELSDLSL
jgi:hypothetical protein